MNPALSYPATESTLYVVMEPKICEWCGRSFSRPVGSNIKFCLQDNTPFPDPKRARQGGVNPLACEEPVGSHTPARHVREGKTKIS